MALIVKGKMPKGTGCDGCKFQTSTCEQLDACTCYLFEGVVHNFHNERHPDCPIIGEIPDKHGRLIEENRAYDSIAEETTDHCIDMDAVGKGLECTPTILEATE